MRCCSLWGSDLAHGVADGGECADGDEQVEHTHLAQVHPHQLRVLLDQVDQEGHAVAQRQTEDLQLVVELPDEIQIVGQEGRDDHQNDADDHTGPAQLLAQQLVALQGAEGDQEAGDGGDEAQTAQQDDACAADQGTADGAQDA